MPADKWDKFVAPASGGGDKWDKFTVDDQPAAPAPLAARAPVPQPAGINGEELPVVGPLNRFLTDTAIKGGDYLKNAGAGLLTPLPVAMGMSAYQQATTPAPENVEQGASQIAGKLGIDPKAVASDAQNQDVGGLINDTAIPAIGAIAGGRLFNKLTQARPAGTAPSGQTVAATSEIHGAALRNAGGAPAKADIGATTSTAAPAMLEAADQLGVHGKNVTPAKWAQVSERAIQNQEDAFNGLVKQADPTTPIAAETRAAADAMRQEALSERNPNVAAKLNEVADRIEKETELGGGNALRQSLNKETIAHHRKVNVSDANADLVNEANLNAVGKMRDIVYGKTGQQLGIPQDAIQQLKMRSSALIRQNDWVQNSRKLIENDRLVEGNTGVINSARYNNQLPNASKSGIISTVGKSILGGRDAAFRSQLSKFLDAPRVPVQYPTANPRVANQSRLAGIVRRAGLNQPATGTPAGARRTPLDDFLQQNRPAYRQPDMGQATGEIMGQPVFQPEGGAQPQFLPRRGNLTLQDINPPHWPQRVQPQAAPTMSPIPAAGAEVPRVAPGQATYYQEPQVPIEWLESQSQPAHPVLREIANKASKGGAKRARNVELEDVTPANWPYQQESQPLPWWRAGEGGGTPRGFKVTKPDVSRTELLDFLWGKHKRR